MTKPLAERLPVSHVHVWQCDLRVPDTRLELYRRNLHPEERRQARTIVSEIARRRFIVRRAFRHIVVGKYLCIPPGKAIVKQGSEGRPIAAGTHGGLRLGCSHSGELAVVAFNRSAQIGIDLQVKRPMREMEEIARYFSFASRRHQKGDAADADEFFAEWTRLEAGAKYFCVGLSKVDLAKVNNLSTQTIFLRHRGEQYALSIACKKLSTTAVLFHRFAGGPGGELNRAIATCDTAKTPEKSNVVSRDER